uniref:Uncharacterized protein n=1 Tax=Arundo donax TaxID=35708 RepID=A0A0A9E4T9_ARUDO
MQDRKNIYRSHAFACTCALSLVRWSNQ